MLVIVHKDVLYKHYKILKHKKNKWSTMAGTFYTTFVTEIMMEYYGYVTVEEEKSFEPTRGGQ